MNSSAWTLRTLNESERAWLFHHSMERDFPDDELKPLPLLESLVALGINQVLGCFDGQTLVGYCVLAQEAGSPMVLLDYLAVEPELRDQGCGGLILQLLLDRLAAGEWLCIESEDPDLPLNEADRAVRERRLAFYLRSGAVRSSVLLKLFGVDFAMLTLSRGETPTDEELEVRYHELYRKMLPEAQYRRKVITMRNS